MVRKELDGKKGSMSELEESNERQKEKNRTLKQEEEELKEMAVAL